MTLIPRATRLGPILLAWVLLATAGCASSGEQLAWQRWEAARDPGPDPSPHVLSSPEPGAAVPDPSLATSADDLIRYAEAHNPGLRATHSTWRADLERAPQARSLPDPMFMFGTFIKPMHTREGPQTQRMGLSQTIPLFGKLGLRGAMAVEDANTAGSRYEAARRDLRYRIVRAWNEYYYLGRNLAITRDNLRLLTHLESVALSSYSAGHGPHSAVMQAQIEIGRLENELLTLEARREPMLAALNAELNREPLAPIPWPNALPQPEITRDPERLREALLRGNPDLRAQGYQVARAQAGATLAGRSPIPDLTLGAEYMVMGRPEDGAPGTGADAFMVSAGISLPIWLGRYQGEKAEAGARRDAAIDQHTQLERMLLSELQRVQFELQDAERRAELYETALIPKARQSMAVTEKSFSSGTAGFAELIEAQRTLLEFDLALEAARVDRATRVAELERLLGNDVSLETAAPREEKMP